MLRLSRSIALVHDLSGYFEFLRDATETIDDALAPAFRMRALTAAEYDEVLGGIVELSSHTTAWSLGFRGLGIDRGAIRDNSVLTAFATDYDPVDGSILLSALTALFQHWLWLNFLDTVTLNSELRLRAIRLLATASIAQPELLATLSERDQHALLEGGLPEPPEPPTAMLDRLRGDIRIDINAAIFGKLLECAQEIVRAFRMRDAVYLDAADEALGDIVYFLTSDTILPIPDQDFTTLDQPITLRSICSWIEEAFPCPAIRFGTTIVRLEPAHLRHWLLLIVPASCEHFTATVSYQELREYMEDPVTYILDHVDDRNGSQFVYTLARIHDRLDALASRIVGEELAESVAGRPELKVGMTSLIAFFIGGLQLPTAVAAGLSAYAADLFFRRLQSRRSSLSA